MIDPKLPLRYLCRVARPRSQSIAEQLPEVHRRSGGPWQVRSLLLEGSASFTPTANSTFVTATQRLFAATRATPVVLPGSHSSSHILSGVLYINSRRHLSGTCKRGLQKGVSLICSETNRNKLEEIGANWNKSEQVGVFQKTRNANWSKSEQNSFIPFC